VASSGPSSRVDPLSVEGTVFKSQLGLATRAQLLAEGITRRQINVALARGRWVRTASGIYALANWPPQPTRRLLAACLVTGGVASFASAAWLWELLKHEPADLAVSVQHGQTPANPSQRSRRPFLGSPDLSTLIIHHSRDLSPQCTSNWRSVPTTNPLRTLVDLAAIADPESLDEAIDVALAKRLVTVEGLVAEAARLRRPRRQGPVELIDRLRKRGLAAVPSPSVLESRTLRLLASANVKVEKCEVVVDGGRYRLDIQVGPRVFVEVDGFAYHWGPEQKRYDDKRRNELRLLGYEILVYDWKAVVDEPRRVVKEIKTAVREQVPAGQRPNRQKRAKALRPRPPRPVTASGRD